MILKSKGVPLIIDFSIFFSSYKKVAYVLEDHIFTLKYQYIQNKTFIHLSILFLACNSNNLIPFKEFFLEKLLYSVIEVEKKNFKFD